jgi:hypothetical protein
MSNPNQPPNLSGRYCVRTRSLEYITSDATVQLAHPHCNEPYRITIRQNGRFFTWTKDDDENPSKLGVFEKVYLRGEFAGWQAYVVSTVQNNKISELNIIKICQDLVRRFEITEIESGFDESDPDQHPRVETGEGKRISDVEHEPNQDA